MYPLYFCAIIQDSFNKNQLNIQNLDHISIMKDCSLSDQIPIYRSSIFAFIVCQIIVVPFMLYICMSLWNGRIRKNNIIWTSSPNGKPFVAHCNLFPSVRRSHLSDKHNKFFVSISDLQYSIVVKKNLSICLIQHLLHFSLNDHRSIGTMYILISHSVICQEQFSMNSGNAVPAHDNICPCSRSSECYSSFANIIQTDTMNLSLFIKKS